MSGEVDAFDVWRKWYSENCPEWDKVQDIEAELGRKEVLMTALNALGQEIIRINTANGWNVTTPEDWDDTYKVPAVLALIHSEVSEALEAFRTNDLTNFAEELADVLIRVLDCAAGLGADMDETVAAKLEKNKHRGFRHGGKRV